jgi:hypothetical protein
MALNGLMKEASPYTSFKDVAGCGPAVAPTPQPPSRRIGPSGVTIDDRYFTRERIEAAVEELNTPTPPSYGQRFRRHPDGGVWLRIRPAKGEERFVNAYYGFDGGSRFTVVAVNLNTGAMDTFRDDAPFFTA